jgi:hypothetical protein
MFRFLRPKLRTVNASYAIGPHYDTEGASRLIFQKQFTYPLDSPFGAGIPTRRPFRVLQPAQLIAQPGVVLAGVVGFPTGGFYSLPVSSPDFES